MDWLDEARRLRSEGHSYDGIAYLLGITKTAAWEALNPERWRQARAEQERRRRANMSPSRRAEENRKRNRRREWRRIDKKRAAYVAAGVLKAE